MSDGSNSTETVSTWSYQCGSTITLSATPYNNRIFAAWIWDDGTYSHGNPITFTLSANRSIIVYFNTQSKPGYLFSANARAFFLQPSIRVAEIA
ncbi:MAG: hypothetical protein ABWK01_00610 [Infirmifilum sp.]